jgi:hypothetical protein
MTQDKKFTAEESSETDIKKDSDVRTCNQNSRQNQEAKRQNQVTVDQNKIMTR